MNEKIKEVSNNDIPNIVKEKHEMFLKELNGLSLWQARHILKCVEESLEDNSVIKSIEIADTP